MWTHMCPHMRTYMWPHVWYHPQVWPRIWPHVRISWGVSTHVDPPSDHTVTGVLYASSRRWSHYNLLKNITIKSYFYTCPIYFKVLGKLWNIYTSKYRHNYLHHDDFHSKIAWPAACSCLKILSRCLRHGWIVGRCINTFFTLKFGNDFYQLNFFIKSI